MKKIIVSIVIISFAFKSYSQNETLTGKLTVYGNIETRQNQNSASYPSLTSRGDIFQLYRNVNNTLEIGVGGRSNTRRSWILSRHYDTSGSYGKYYSTLHLQPDTGNKSQYRGVAIGFNANQHIGLGTHLAINGNVGIGTVSPSTLLEIKQKDDPNSDKGLIISEHNNSQKIHLHLADNASGEYGYFNLGGNTILRGNGQNSSFHGALAIGSTSIPNGYKLAVSGKTITEEVKVQKKSEWWSDFVFEKNYKLPTLEEVENHIQEKGHLKDIPSAKEVEKNGIFLGEMNAKLLQKIEELTLYTIEQDKGLKKLNVKVNELEKKNKLLMSLLERISKIENKLEKS